MRMQEMAKLRATPADEYGTTDLGIAAFLLAPEFDTARLSRGGFTRAEEQLIQRLEELSGNEILTMPVAKLARKFSCSQRQLNRLFHHCFGVSVAPLRMELRLLRAMALLRDPSAKVTRVAEECGFNHLGLFYECFKRRFGSSPGKWRRRVTGAAPPPVSLPEGEQACRMLNAGLCPWKCDLPAFKPQNGGGNGRFNWPAPRYSLSAAISQPQC